MHVRRQAEELCQLLRDKDTHPAYPNAFRPCRQPEILDGEADAEQIGIEDRVAAQDMRTTPHAIARDAQVERAFQNPFELHSAVQRGTLARVVRGSPSVLTHEHALDGPTDVRVVDDDEIPRLHETYRGGMMRCGKHTGEDSLRDRIGPEL